MYFIKKKTCSCQDKQGALEPDDSCAGVQRAEDLHGDELPSLWRPHCKLQGRQAEVSSGQKKKQKQCINAHLLLREKKRERERDDLWRKMQDLSLKNAAKEGISLGTGID